MYKNRRGFTIVELLIVIVIIAILAAITIVAYNGIKDRAQVSVAKSDLSALGKQTELFKIDNGDSYPTLASQWKTVFQNANLYNITRVSTEKSFVICYRADAYAIVAVVPITNRTNGAPNYYVGPGGLSTFNWDTSVTGTFDSDRLCKQTPVAASYSSAWSYNLP